jgi:hypothetical protein
MNSHGFECFLEESFNFKGNFNLKDIGCFFSGYLFVLV